jgi:hypothetical protein
VEFLYGPLSLIHAFFASDDEKVKFIDFEQICLKQQPMLKESASTREKVLHNLQIAHQQHKNKSRQVIQTYLLSDNSINRTRKQIVEEIEVIQLEKDLFFQLKTIHTWIKLGNKGMARNLIKEFVKKSPLDWLEHSIGVFLTEDEKKTIKNNSIIHLRSIKDQLSSEYIDLLLLYFDQFVSRDYFTSISSVKSVDYSSNKIRELSSNLHFGMPFPSVWYHQFAKRMKNIEAAQYLNDSFSTMSDSERLKFLWLMVFHVPHDLKSRQILKIFIQEKINNLNLFIPKQLVVMLLENTNVLAWLEDEKISIAPIFKIKKNLYTQCLKTNYSYSVFSFCLIQLQQLGVENMDVLIEKL